MSKGEIARLYSQLGLSEQHAFQIWLTNTAVVASLFAFALMAIVWAGSFAVQGQAPVEQARSTELSAVGAVRPAAFNSPHDLMLQIPAAPLPIERVDAPH